MPALRYVFATCGASLIAQGVVIVEPILHRKNVALLLFLLIATVAVLLRFSCGSGGGGDSPAPSPDPDVTSAGYIDQLTTLESNVSNDTISGDQFLTDLDSLFTTIDGATVGTSAFKTYLEENITGYSFTWNKAVAGSTTKATTDDIKTTIAKIKASQTYQMLEAFLSSVIFSGVPSPAAEALQVADPTTFVTLSTVQVRTHINDALYSNQIDIVKAQELFDINNTNPYDAERQLLTATGQSIPAWLQPASTACLRNCETSGGTFTGSFSKGGNFSRAFIETTCTWNIVFTGNIELVLDSGSSTTVSGTAQVWGTEGITALSGSTSTFTCETGTSVSFNDWDTVTGNTSSMKWTTDLSGGAGAFMGDFTGSVSGSTATGTIAVRYTKGTGSLSIPVTLTKK